MTRVTARGSVFSPCTFCLFKLWGKEGWRGRGERGGGGGGGGTASCVGLVVKASSSRMADLCSIPAFEADLFLGRVIPGI